MTIAPSSGTRSKSLVLTAMIFAVAMTFIDQTIVSIAAPTIQHDLGLSSSGMQWAINAYLLALAAPPLGVRPHSADAPAKMITPSTTILRCPAMSASRPPKANSAASVSR